MAFRYHGDLSEGRLTDLRKALVNAAALARLAEEVGVGGELLLGKGEAAAGGRHKPSILADALEAVVGAVYLDGGPDAALDVVARLLGARLTDAVNGTGGLDHKTTLQELTARLFDTAPVYVLQEDGPDHAKRFFAEVLVNGERFGSGQGRSKKQAEQEAARAACERLRTEPAVGVA